MNTHSITGYFGPARGQPRALVNRVIVLMTLVLALSASTLTFAQSGGRAIDVVEANSSAAVDFISDLSPFGEEKRIALVIGNQDYLYSSPLSNPVKDANSMKMALEEHANFEVILGINLYKQEMDELVRQFERRLALAGPDAVGLVFYAGHGVAYDGVNYLLPVDVDFSTNDRYVASQGSVALNDIIDALNPNLDTPSIVILDACRDNPFVQQSQKSLGGSGGWARQRARGAFIAYGTEHGRTASDGQPGMNGVFTGSILKHLEMPGKTIDELFTDVTNDVALITAEEQVPEVVKALSQSFVLHECTMEDGCGSAQMNIIYGLLAAIALLILGSVLYIRKLAMANHRGFAEQLEVISEPLTRPIWGARSDNDVVALEPDLGSGSLMPDAASSKGRIVGYLRHNRHNIELGQIREGDTLTVGREQAPGIDIVINDTRSHIARTQARIGWDAHRRCFWVMDLGSKNGTYLGRDERLKPHEIYYLSSGQTFYFASKKHPMTIVQAAG